MTGRRTPKIFSLMTAVACLATLVTSPAWSAAVVVVPVEVPSGATNVYLDAVSGNDSASGTVGQPWRTLSRAQTFLAGRKSATNGTVLHLAPGQYGRFGTGEGWNSGTFASQVIWRADDRTNLPKFDGLYINCSPNCTARQVFDGIDVMLLAKSSRSDTTISIVGVDDIQIRNSKIHNEQLYQSSHGVKIQKSNRVSIRGTEIYRVVHAIRYNGDNHLIDGNEIHTFAGSAVSMLCGGRNGRPQSARFGRISNNTIHNQQGDFPGEAFYGNFDEPQELHASVIGIRGADMVIEGNWIFDIEDSVTVQFYVGDCGVSNYQVGNIVFRNNVFYSLSHNSLIQGSASPSGPIIVEYNTVLDGILFIDLSKDSSLGYQGEGTILRNNLVISPFGSALNRSTENYTDPAAKWISENNLGGEQFFNHRQTDPSNVFIRSDRPSGYKNTIFQNPNFSDTLKATCAPRGTGNCDWTPRADSEVCSMGSDGGHVGAIPCAGGGAGSPSPNPSGGGSGGGGSSSGSSGGGTSGPGGPPVAATDVILR